MTEQASVQQPSVTAPFPGVDHAEWEALLARGDAAGWVHAEAITHALRFTVVRSRRAYIPPATHFASKLTDANLPPMGMRLRLRADYDLSTFSPEARVILQALKKYGMIVADNGSTDGSIEIAEKHGARVVRVAEKGYGSALRSGIEAAHGRWILMGDADDSYDFSQLDAFVNSLRAGTDLVMGNRFLGGVRPGAKTPKNEYASKPGSPDAVTVGNPGASDDTARVVTASTFSLPERAYGIATPADGNITCRRPPTRSTSASALPL